MFCVDHILSVPFQLNSENQSWVISRFMWFLVIEETNNFEEFYEPNTLLNAKILVTVGWALTHESYLSTELANSSTLWCDSQKLVSHFHQHRLNTYQIVSAVLVALAKLDVLAAVERT